MFDMFSTGYMLYYNKNGLLYFIEMIYLKMKRIETNIFVNKLFILFGITTYEVMLAYSSIRE